VVTPVPPGNSSSVRGDNATFCHQAHPFSPVGWHYIAYIESLWLLERGAGTAPLFKYRRLFVADGLPKTERVNLPLEKSATTWTRLEKVLRYLETSDLDQQERLWRWLIQHESQHSEIITFVLQLQRWRASGEGRSWELGENPLSPHRITHHPFPSR